MSIMQPSRIPVLPYEPSTVRRRFERTEAYFLVSPICLHHALTNCSFHAREGCSSKIYCDNTPSSIQNGGIPYDASAVIFEVTGKIRHELCFITTNGNCDHPDTSEEALSACADFAPCWLEASGNTAEERKVWQHALHQLRRIACRADPEVCMDEFLQPAPSNRALSSKLQGLGKKYSVEKKPAFLQVSWAPPHLFGLNALPIFSAGHEHIQIPSPDRVPFDKRVRARFTLQLASHPAVEKKGPVIGASILYMHVLD